MSEKHTPGPWEVDWEGDAPFGLEITGSDITKKDGNQYKNIIAVVDSQDWSETENITPLCQANARLMAASPDLLDALTDLVGGCGKEGDLHSEAAHAKARAAIAKATNP